MEETEFKDIPEDELKYIYINKEQTQIELDQKKIDKKEVEKLLAGDMDKIVEAGMNSIRKGIEDKKDLDGKVIPEEDLIKLRNQLDKLEESKSLDLHNRQLRWGKNGLSHLTEQIERLESNLKVLEKQIRTKKREVVKENKRVGVD